MKHLVKLTNLSKFTQAKKVALTQLTYAIRDFKLNQN